MEIKKITPRQWALYRIIKRNSLVEKRKTTQKEICDILWFYGYVYDAETNSHDRCPAIWTDIKDINISYDLDKVIITKNFEYWIGDESETKAFLDTLWRQLYPRLQRYHLYSRKLKRDGQGKLLSNRLIPIDNESKAREYIESYGTEKISKN